MGDMKDWLMDSDSEQHLVEKNPHIAASLIKILSRQNNPLQKKSINGWKNPSSKRLLIFEAFCGKQMLTWKLNIW